MLQVIKNLLYDLIVWSGIVNIIFPWLPRLGWVMFGRNLKANFEAKDASGATLKLSFVSGRLYPPYVEHKIPSLLNMKIRRDDVLLCGYPKTGCHWVHEIMHMLVNRKIELTKNAKGLGGMIDLYPQILMDSLPSPRVLNSHLLHDELPREITEKKTKIVFTIRNPKDTVVSFYNHHKALKSMYGYDGAFNDYFKLFMEGKVDYGSYFDHTLEWDKVMKCENANPILLLEFEELKSEPVKSILRIAEFLGIKITEQFAADVARACDFDRMKQVRTETAGREFGKLYRKGVVGDWKNWLTDAQSEEIDRVWQERMKGCTYQPKY